MDVLMGLKCFILLPPDLANEYLLRPSTHSYSERCNLLELLGQIELEAHIMYVLRREERTVAKVSR